MNAERQRARYRYVLQRIKWGIRRSLGDARRRLVSDLPGRLIVVVGTGYRVGSTWLYHMLRAITTCRMGIDRAPAQFTRFGTLVLQPESYAYLRQLRGRVIFKSHSNPPRSTALSEAAEFVTIYRDPRDVLVSASFYLAHLGEDRGGWAEPICHRSDQERIQLLIAGRAPYPVLPRLEAWYRTPYAYKIRYEDLRSRPVDELMQAATALGASVPEKIVSEVAHKWSFKSRTGRDAGDTRDHLPMRKGIVGDWRNYFDQACRDAFQTQEGGRWNRLLVEMGYEDSLDW
jgi:hypothetical protein